MSGANELEPTLCGGPKRKVSSRWSVQRCLKCGAYSKDSEPCSELIGAFALPIKVTPGKVN